MFSTGHKLSRTEILQAMIDAIRVRDLNAEGVHSKSELEERMKALMQMTLEQTAEELKKEKEKGE